MSNLVAGRSGGIAALLIAAGVVHGCGAGGDEPGASQFPATAVNGALDAGNPQALPMQQGVGNPAQPGAGNPAQPGAGNPVTGTSSPSPGGGSVTGSVASSSGLPCNVQKIVAAKCAATCHSDPPVATFMALTKQSDWQQQGTTDKTKKYFELAKLRVNSADKPMPPSVSPQLTADEKLALNAWLNAGAPASSETCADTTPPKTGGAPNDSAASSDTTGLDCYKFLAHAPGDKKAKFKVGTAVDKYMFLGFQAPWQSTVYGVVIKPVIDNSKVLHHWLLYKEDVADGSVMTTLAQHNTGELIHGWAPGGISLDFRRHSDDVSVELPATTYGLELHYNSSDANALDASGVEVCVKKAPTKNLASMTWLGYDQGGIIAYGTGICLEPKSTWEGTCKPVSKEPIHLMFMLPHLHQTGRHLKSVINGPNGSRVLLDKPFDFNYQTTYETHEILMPGETITTTCTFSEAKCAGKATSQEMCYNFTYAWPKHALVDNGPEGTTMHGAGVCLGQ